MVDRERRGAVRVPKRIEIRYSSNSPEMSGFVEDLSELGMFVDASQPLLPGAEIEFWLRLPDATDEEPVHGRGSVVWSDRTGMAVEFHDLGKETRERIRFFVGSVFFGQG